MAEIPKSVHALIIFFSLIVHVTSHKAISTFFLVIVINSYDIADGWCLTLSDCPRTCNHQWY